MSENPFGENCENNENNENSQNEQNMETMKDSENTDNANTESEANEEIENNEDIQEDKNDFEEKYNELNNKYIRLAADFDNFRKRTQSEKEELTKYAQGEILKKIISALDTFDRAREQLNDIEDCKTVKESYEVAYKQLLDLLSKAGLTEIDALGKEFNPNDHEAVTQILTDEYEPDTVAAVMQKGYKMADRVLRPAMVGVARAKE